MDKIKVDYKGRITLRKFNDTLNSWDYGVLIKDIVYTDPDLIDWKKYRTIPIDKIEKYQVGVCYDFVNFQTYIFNKSSIKNRCYLFIGVDNKNETITHTFNILYLPDGLYWFESGWLHYQGIRKINNYNDVIEKIKKYYHCKHYDVYTYNTNGLDKDLTAKEYLHRIYNQTLVYTTQIGKKSVNCSKLDKNHRTKKQKFTIIDLKDERSIDRNIVKGTNKMYEAVKYLYKNKHKYGEIAIDKNGNFAGYVCVNKSGILGPLYIEPNYRGYGLSNILFKDAIENWNAWKLGVYTDNEVAIRLYKKFGFEITGIKKYSDGTMIYIMERM